MTTSSRYLIPVADDFGLSRGVNGGVIEAHERGVVTSAALLVNFAALADAVDLARAFPRLSVGLHVNLTLGRPVTPAAQVPTLVNAMGNFCGLTGFLQRLIRGKVALTEVSVEIDAQFSRYAETGLPLDFVNGQHHIHLVSPILELLVARLKDGARILRVPSVPWRLLVPGLGTGFRPRLPSVGRVAAALLAGRARGRLNGLSSNDAFLHVDRSEVRRPGASNPFIGALRHATGAVNELMCHPAHVDLPLRYIDDYVDEREVELAYLCDVALRRAIRREGLILASYREVRK